MKFNIDLSTNINEQFKRYIGGESLDQGFIIHPDVGTNQAKSVYVLFPDELELYHFGLTRFKVPIRITTTNSSGSEWYLIHINLSKKAQEKHINNEKIYFQRNLPVGILFCGPDLEMVTEFPSGTESEVLSIRFSINFLKSYFSFPNNTIDVNRSIAYEDIDENLNVNIEEILHHLDNKLKCHSHLLDFLNHFFEKLSKHEKPEHMERLHANDLERIIQASVVLRNPTQTRVPKVEELAKQAHMGITKFKKSFKLVFGKPPMQYRNRIRMEYARDALQKKMKTTSELSHELGYSHPSNFTAAFKRYFGELPSAVPHSSFVTK